MARGHQKIQSQQKNAEKKAAAAKGAKSPQEKEKEAMAALKATCVVCKAQMVDLKGYRTHFEAKHPKAPLPPELAAPAP
eukprot:m.230592 g.230592  ORF g.230592 m.230592 type:complete len:79 (-) comp18087_c0_seq1:115-351(-)